LCPDGIWARHSNQSVLRKILALPHLKLHYQTEEAKYTALEKTISRSLKELATDGKDVTAKINKFLAS
jgi:hypothetical protein